jgi:hypothetical protein
MARLGERLEAAGADGAGGAVTLTGAGALGEAMGLAARRWPAGRPGLPDKRPRPAPGARRPPTGR